MSQEEDYNICLTIVMARDGNYTPMPLIRKSCHCVGKHFKARGEIDETVLAQCEELGKVIAAGCEAGIY